MLKSSLRRSPFAPVGAAVIAAASLGFISSAEAQCARGIPSCSEVGANFECSATLMCSNAPSNDTWTLIRSSSLNVLSCSPQSQMIVGATVTFDLMVTAAFNAPYTRSCTWSWYTPSSVGTAGFGTVEIDESDGLPVELMELEVYEE